MASKKQKKKDQNVAQTENQWSDSRTPWISYKTGIIVISITSVVMTVLSSIEFINNGVQPVEGILRGLAYGVLIWAIFFGYIYFTRFIRRL